MSKGKKALVLVIISMIAGLVYLTPFLRFSFYDQMMAALQLTDAQIGTIGGIYGLFNVLGYIPSGLLSEKFKTKYLLIISTLGMFLTTVWYCFYPDFTQLCIIHALYGVFSVWTFWSAYLKAVRHLGTEEEQSRMFGMSEGLRGVGQTAVAFLCLGVLGAMASVTAGFRVALIINAAAFAILMLLVIFLVPNFENESNTGEKKPGLVRVIVDTLKNPGVWVCIFVIMCGYALWNSINGYLGTYTTRVLGVPEDISSTLAIVRSYIIVFVAGFTGGFIMDKFKTRGQGMILAFACCALSAALVFITSNMMFVCIGVTVVLAYMVNVIKATYWSILGEAGVPLASTGMATGVISLIGLTPDIFSSPVIASFLTYGESQGDIVIGFNMMLGWLVAWSVLGIIASLLLKRRAKITKANAGSNGKSEYEDEAENLLDQAEDAAHLSAAKQMSAENQSSRATAVSPFKATVSVSEV